MRGTIKLFLILLSTSILTLTVAAKTHAQAVLTYDQARALCTSEGGRAVITTPHTDSEGGGATYSEQRSFNCVITVEGEECDRFTPPERQSGCIVVPSTSIEGRTAEQAATVFQSAATSASTRAQGSTGTSQNAIDKYLALGVNVLTAVAGLAITGSIIVGGLQYASAGGNASQVSSAKNRIFVSVASLILLGFGFAILQWLVPGGIFN